MADGPRQVVVVSNVDWSSPWQRHQIFASGFAAEGREVFFVENTGFREPSLRDALRVKDRLAAMLSPRPSGGSNPVPPGVRVIAPRVLPPTRPLFRALNARVFVPRLFRALNAAGLRPGAALVIYLPTTTALELARRLKPSAVLYDCASNFRGHPDAPPDFLEIERALLDLSGRVVCDSDFLYAQKKTEHPFVEKIHQGVPDAFFNLPPPRGTWDDFCYYGTWSADLEPKLVDALSAAGFRAAVRGFTKGGAPALSPTVARRPPVPRDEVAAGLTKHEVLILPYRLTPFLMGVVPAKIYECLASGRPVIATPLPSLKSFGDLIYFGETPEDWVRVARGLPRTETPERRARRVETARAHSCAAEFARFSASLDAAAAP
jgi:hypothetical protein